MVIKEFNFFLKNTQTSEAIERTLLPKLEDKSNSETGYIANVYDIEAKKKYLLVTNNVKDAQKLSDNLFEFDIKADVQDIDLSEYYTKSQSDAKFATKEEIAKIQVGDDVELTGYLKEEKALELYALKTELDTLATKDDLEAKADTDNVYTKAEVDQKVLDAATGGKVDLGGYYTKEEIDEKLKTLPSTPIEDSQVTAKDDRVDNLVIDIEEIKTSIDNIQDGLTKNSRSDNNVKQSIKDVYNTLYKKILELEEEIKVLKSSNDSYQPKDITEEDIPTIDSPVFNEDIKTEEDIKIEEFENDPDIVIGELPSGGSDEDGILIFD